MVKKKNNIYRLCADYRKVNSKMCKSQYPLRLIEDQIDALHDARVFSTIDLRNGLFHVPVEGGSKKYTAFVVPGGHFAFFETFFRLSNSPAVFQRYVNIVFAKLILEGIVVAYMGDLIIRTRNPEIGEQSLERVLQVTSANGLDINCCGRW